MDDKQFSCIAAVSCTSKATVSKVLNHCYGVGSQVRARVLAQADRMQIGAEVKPVEVYAVFPELPGYFKQSALNHPEDLLIKYNVYSHMEDEELLLRYLDQAEALGARVILLVAEITERVRLRLQTLAQNCLVILLARYGEMTDCFYVGSDPQADGKRLAELCGKEAGSWLVLKDSTAVCRARLHAFAEEMAEHTDWEAITVDPARDTARSPSMLARQLSERLTPSHCGVVCLGEQTKAVCAAIRKLKLPGKVVCVGMGDAGLEAQFAASGILKGAVYPDYPGQLRKAIDLASRYAHTGLCPDRKFVFTESALKTYL